MKRKRGHKKGKSKHSEATDADNTADIPVMDEEEEEEEEVDDNAELDSETETAEEYNEPLINMAGPGRVKLKLKTSKPSEPQQIAHQSQSDTDKSGSYLSLEKQEKEEEVVVDKNISKPISKSSRPIDSGTSSLHDHGERIIDAGGSKGNTFVNQEPPYNEKGLVIALDVIRKIMKMDAAKPFNAPVDPIAFGIPETGSNWLGGLDNQKQPSSLNCLCQMPDNDISKTASAADEKVIMLSLELEETKNQLETMSKLTESQGSKIEEMELRTQEYEGLKKALCIERAKVKDLEMEKGSFGRVENQLREQLILCKYNCQKLSAEKDNRKRHMSIEMLSERKTWELRLFKAQRDLCWERGVNGRNQTKILELIRRVQQAEKNAVYASNLYRLFYQVAEEHNAVTGFPEPVPQWKMLVAPKGFPTVTKFNEE